MQKRYLQSLVAFLHPEYRIEIFVKDLSEIGILPFWLERHRDTYDDLMIEKRIYMRMYENIYEFI